MDAFGRHFFHGDDIRVLADALIGIDHLRQTTALGLHEDVGKQQREGLITDQFARAPDGVSKPERRLLTREAFLSRTGEIASQTLELALAIALGQGQFKLELAVEMVLDDTFVASGDEDKVL